MALNYDERKTPLSQAKTIPELRKYLDALTNQDTTIQNNGRGEFFNLGSGDPFYDLGDESNFGALRDIALKRRGAYNGGGSGGEPDRFIDNGLGNLDPQGVYSDDFTNREIFDSLAQTAGSTGKYYGNDIGQVVNQSVQYDPFTDYRTKAYGDILSATPGFDQRYASYNSARKKSFNKSVALSLAAFAGVAGGGALGLFGDAGAAGAAGAAEGGLSALSGIAPSAETLAAVNVPGVSSGVSGFAGGGGSFLGQNGFLGNTGSSLANSIGNSAIRGGLTSAVTGGDPLTGALKGGIGGGVGDFTSGFDTGFGKTGNDIFGGAVKGAVGGAFGGNTLAGALTGGAGAGAGSVFKNGLDFGSSGGNMSFFGDLFGGGDTSFQEPFGPFTASNIGPNGEGFDYNQFDPSQFAPSNIFDIGPNGEGFDYSSFDPTSIGLDPIEANLGTTGFGNVGLYNSGLGGIFSNAAGGAASSGTQSLLQRLLGGGQSGLGGLGSLLGSGLGAYGASRESSRLSDLANRYEGYGAPSRARYEGSYAPGFTMNNDPGFTDALNQSAKATLHGLSAQGNPSDSPNAWQQSLTDLFQKNAYPALQNYRQTNANTGGIANFQGAAPGLQTQAIGSKSNVLNAIGSGVSNIFSPPQTLAQQLAELKNSGFYS